MSTVNVPEAATLLKVHETIARDIPQLARGQVWCRKCGATQRVDSAVAMRYGWPKCCGYTMTIDSPEEHGRLADKVPNAHVTSRPPTGND